MKRARLMATVAFAAAGAMTMAAQETRTPGSASPADQGRPNQPAPTTQTPTTQSPTTQKPSTQAAGGTMTLTGCIQSSGGAAGGGATTYTLAANAAGSGASSSAGAATRPGQSASTAGMTTYTLEGSEVAKHVGHQVEITGSVAPSSGATRAGDTASARPDDRAGSGNERSAVGTAGSSGDRQTFRVTSVKMLAATCSR